MGTRLRLSDLAARAGVSVSTVSRVLNDRPGISGGKRQAVMDAMASLGYTRERPQQRTGTIGLIVPELSNPSFPEFVERLDALFRPTGFRTIITTAGPLGANEAACVGALCELRVDGMVSISGAASDAQADLSPYAHLMETGMPAVFVNGLTDTLSAGFINCSDEEAIASSVAHLRSLGHERIGLAVGPDRFLPSRRKSAKFLNLGFSQESIASTIFTTEGGRVAGARLLESGHTAIVCGSDLMALGVIREAHARGLRVPEDLSVIGFDDSVMMAFTRPALTTIRQPIQAMCEATVAELLRAIDGNGMDGTELLFHPDLIIRESTGPRS